MNKSISTSPSIASALCRCSLIGLLLAGFTVPGQAALEVVPDVGLYMATDDNPRLRTTTEGTDTSGALEARVNFATFGARGEFTAEPRFRGGVYSDTGNGDLDSDDIFLRTSGRYAWRVMEVGFRGDFSDQSVRTSEVTAAAPIDPDIDDPVDTDTGQFILYDQTRTRSIFRPYVDFRISDRNSLLIEARRLDVAYSGPIVPGRSDFDDSYVAVGILRRVDERNRVTAQFIASDFESDETQNKTDTVGAQGRFTRPISADWTLNLTVGVQRSDYHFIDEDDRIVDNADTDPTFSVVFRRRTDQTTLNVGAYRRVSPNASGFLTRRNEIRLFLEHQMTPRVSWRTALRLFESESVAGVNPLNDRDYIRVELGAQWAVTQRLSLSLGYQFTNQEFVNRNRGDAEANQLFTGFNYHGISRR